VPPVTAPTNAPAHSAKPKPAQQHKVQQSPKKEGQPTIKTKVVPAKASGMDSKKNGKDK
jgi:hypothetical protein